LVYHTSGLKDWGFLAFLTGWPRTQKFYTNKDALNFIIHQKSLNNEPGAEHLYSNSNYNLLAILVQRVSGLSLADFTYQHIFKPAGMVHTQWRDNPHRIVPNRALAYRKVEQGYQTDMPNESAYGNGGLLTTSEDLLKWQEFYLRSKLGTSSLLARQTHTEPLKNGRKNDYAAGLEIIEVAGSLESISHSGATAGYRAYLEALPKSGFALALLSNTSQNDVLSLATAVRKLFVSSPPAAVVKHEVSAAVPLATLVSYTGWYKNSRDGSALQLAVKDGILLADNEVRLRPLAAQRFEMGDELLEMDGTRGLRLIDAAGDTTFYAKAAAARASDNFSVYLGKYYSEETSSFLSVFQSGGKLKLSFKPTQEYELVHTIKNGFIVPATGTVLNFTKRGKRKATLKISVPRARNVEFIKVPASNKKN
jgi:CubicO group peptidase (beta-lactamase class C family)